MHAILGEWQALKSRIADANHELTRDIARLRGQVMVAFEYLCQRCNVRFKGESMVLCRYILQDRLLNKLSRQSYSEHGHLRSPLRLR